MSQPTPFTDDARNSIKVTCSKPQRYTEMASLAMLTLADEFETPLDGEGVKYTFEVNIQPLRPHEAAEFVALIKPVDAMDRPEYESANGSRGESVDEIVVDQNETFDDISFYTPIDAGEVFYVRSVASSETLDDSSDEPNDSREAEHLNEHVCPTDDGFDADSESESPRKAKTVRKKRSGKVLMTC